MKVDKRSLIVFGGGERVLIDELMSTGRSVLGVTNVVLEVDEKLADLLPSMVNVPGRGALNYVD